MPEECLEEEEIQELQTLIELMANSLVEIIGVSSIRFVEKVLGKEVSFLTYTGVTHNLIDSMSVERLGLKIQQLGSFEVEVADDEKVKGSECCKGVILHIQGYESKADLLVVPLGDMQLVLGTVWLKSLGSTLWDISKKTLQF